MSNPEYDYLFKVRARSPSGRPRSQIAGPLCLTWADNASPPIPDSPQLLLIGDSGVGKSCLLLRFAVSAVLARSQQLPDAWGLP